MKVHVEIAAETLFHIGPLSVTNSMLTMFIVMAAILLFFTSVARNMEDVPGKGQSIVEIIIEFLMGLVEGSAGRRAARTIFPLVGGLFIFILVANYSGLLPGVGTVGFYRDEETAAASAGTVANAPTHDIASASVGDSQTRSAPATEATHEKILVPYFRAPNADLNMTLALALVTFTVVQIAGVRAHGPGGRIKHLANPPFLFPIEVISEFSRIISLSARLFGNVFAGEVLLGVMYAMANAIKIAIIPLFFPVVFLFLELLFGAVQALVFGLLTLIYITLATEGGHDEQTHEAHGAATIGQGMPQ
ncbi:MAG: F0F1 ATP synthase subunit A [Thermomicrobiales bacterium]